MKKLSIGLVFVILFCGCIEGIDDLTGEKLLDCESIEDGDAIDGCYEGTAIVKEDPSICDRIESESQKDDCYVNVMKVAFVKKNAEACEKFPDEDQRGECYIIVAYAKKDPALCENIQDQYDKEECYGFIGEALEGS